MDDEESDMWDYLPETLLLNVFSYLNAKELVSAREVCARWSVVALDEMLWKRLLYRDFQIDPSIVKPADRTWSGEYCRLCDEVPCVLTESIRTHTDQVLHVSFSNDSSMFATTSKDGIVIVWNATSYPMTEKYGYDMMRLCWKYPHFSQFNDSDTLLLVSGVHFGSIHNTSGEIAVFSLGCELSLQCRVTNKPVDTFGAWIGDQHLVSSELHWLAHHTSMSMLWVNRASQAPESERIPVISQLYRLYNCNASTTRCIKIASDKVKPKDRKPTQEKLQTDYCITDTLTMKYQPAYYDNERRASEACNESEKESSPESSESDIAGSGEIEESSLDRKLLIYTCGTDTHVSHNICFKYIEDVEFPTQLKRGPTIEERLAARRRQKEWAGDEPDWTDYESVRHAFDEPDHVINVEGRIVGMELSPDHRYLYVNMHRCPPDSVTESPLSPPPVSRLLSACVVCLDTLRVVGTLVRPDVKYSHIAHYKFLDVSDEYVASGAEDTLTYMWDRHYGSALTHLHHGDVVNAVAFAKQGGVLLTACDDYTVGVWRSRREVRKLGIIRPDSRVTLYGQSKPCPRCDNTHTDPC